MASPFAVFRKNQQTLLVLLFILAMFAFIIMDSLSPERLSLPLLGMLLGMIVLTAIGVALKKPLQYAAAGAIGGWLAGSIAIWSGISTPEDSVVIKSSLGELDQLAVRNLVEQRHLANNFLSRAAMKALGEQGQFGVRRYLFEMDGSIEQQTALALILRNEAEKMGIAINSDAVTSYIREATQDKLTKEAFKEILSDMRVSENTLYDILADEITVKTTLELLAPPFSSSTPSRLWENFKKMEVTQSLQVVAVPVEAFGESIPKPGDDELIAFFEQHKNSFRGTPKPADFGFFQPRKVQLAYLEASYLEVEQMVAEVADEEVEKFYEDNKDILFLNRQVPDFSRGQLIEPSRNPDIPELFDPANPSDSKEQPDESRTDKVPPEPDDATPAPDKSDSDAPKSEENDSDKKAAAPAEQPTKESSQLSPAQSLQTVAFVVQEEKKETESVKVQDKPENPPADSKQGDKPQAEAGTEEKAEEKTVPKPTVPPEPEAPSQNVPPAPEEPVGELPLVAEKPQPKYQPLDSALKDSIRDQLLRDRTRVKQKELIALVFERMVSLSNGYFAIGTAEFDDQLNKADADKTRLKFIEDARKELRELAKKHGLNYGETPLMDFQELSESGEHPIGSAVIGDDPAEGSSQSVAEKMFRGSPESVYEADRATSLDLNSAFSFWKTADVEAHVPKFEDEGIREQVLEAWIELKSRPVAEKRAEALKTKLEKTEAPWSEVLAEETISGEKEGLMLSTRTTERFSWMRTRSVPSQFGINIDRAEL
ncbi:MAG TPA: hypothetical protein VMM56_05410, partial [Planctomycetaceae bacterium]|nr:hypothetical protein [Planctomycetaceae bacterium]